MRNQGQGWFPGSRAIGANQEPPAIRGLKIDGWFGRNRNHLSVLLDVDEPAWAGLSVRYFRPLDQLPVC
jgi:hypothetical protein